MYGRSGVAKDTRGRHAGWVSESGRMDLGIPEEAGVLARKVLSAGKSCRRRKLECAEDFDGAEEVSCMGEIAGTMAISSVGIGI